MPDLEDLFGQPSDSYVQEACLLFRKRHQGWPLWEEFLEQLEEFTGVEDRADALTRLEEAIADEEVIPRLAANGESFYITLGQEDYDRLVRRNIAIANDEAPEDSVQSIDEEGE